MNNSTLFDKSKLTFENISLFIIGFALSMYHIFTAFFGPLPSYQHRVIHLGLSMMLVLFTYKFKITNLKFKRSFQVISMAIIVLFTGYALSIADVMWKQSGRLNSVDVVLGTLLVIILIYLTWKVVGPALPIISMICIVYAFVGPYLPATVGHVGFSWTRIVELLYKSVNGIYGTSLGASSIYVAIFVIFASFLETSGAGDVFIRLTQSKLGSYRGGAAKVGVVASALFGTVSGSAVANVVGTGSLTIPMMKKTGFKPVFAGAVEAVASSGGQIMPPVMGAAAFIMADMVGSYQLVLAAALIPAILYYLALYFMIDLEALKYGLKGVPKSELPNFMDELKKGWYLIIPLVVLIFFLVVVRFSPQKSAIYAITLLILICMLHPSKRQGILSILKGVSESARGIPSVALTTATSGIIVGLLMLTGLGYKLSSILVDISNGNVFILLFLTMIVSVILGMGMPTSGAYILLATLIVPALTDLGINLLSAHFFVFYFGVLANITPPVAIASYTAAGISGADAMKTGFVAWRLSLAGFILPFLFAFNPALISQGQPMQIVQAVFTATVGIFGLACAIQRYFKGNLSILKSGLLLLGSLSMMVVGTFSDLLGAAIIILILGTQFIKAKKSTDNVLEEVE